MEIIRSKNTDREPTKDLLDFFYLSFKYSQGAPSIQYQIFNWAKAVGIYKLESGLVPVEALKKRKVPKFHRHLDPNKKPINDLVLMWDRMFHYFQMPGSKPEVYLKDIYLGSLNREIYLLSKGREGRGSQKFPKTDSKEDPFASLIRSHVVVGNSAGHHVYDKMFLEMIPFLNINDGVDGELLLSVAQLWEKRHQGEKFFPERF